MERVAVLVDGDNIGADFAQEIEDIGKRQGRIDVMRVYANLSGNSGWLKRAGFRLFHAGCGKNAADVLLSIDAMELALIQGFDSFVIASSDGDFVHLAQRLRERGASVVGVGEVKAPMTYQQACSAFEVVGKPKAKPAKLAKATPESNSADVGITELDEKIRKMIGVNSMNGHGMPIAELGQKMRTSHGILISNLSDKNWRAYLSKRKALYELDRRGPKAKVRFIA